MSIDAGISGVSYAAQAANTHVKHSPTSASLDVNLVYNSYEADDTFARIISVMGFGWTHSYNQFLYSLNGHMFRFGPAGVITKYQLGANWTYTPDVGYFEALVKQLNGSYLLTGKDGTAYLYGLVPNTPFSYGGPVYRLLSITDRNGNVTSLAYSAGFLTAVTDTYGRSVNFGYNAAKKLVSVTDHPVPGDSSQDRTTSIYYNANNTLVTKITDPEGKSAQYTYDNLYRMTRLVDKDSRVFTVDYSSGFAVKDGLGATLFRLSSEFNWALDNAASLKNLVRMYQVNPSNGYFRTTVTDGRGNKWHYDFDYRGRLGRRVAPDGATTTWLIDQTTGLVATRIDANGHRTTYEYDRDLNGNALPLRGNLTKVTDHNGNFTTYEYDPRGQALFDLLIRESHYAAGSPSPYSKDEFVYDARGNRTQDTRDVGGLNIVTKRNFEAGWSVATPTQHGRELSETLVNYNPVTQTTTDQTTTQEFNDAVAYGSVVKITDPEGHTTQFQYDGIGNVTAKTDGNNHTWVYTYDKLNRLATETDPQNYKTLYRYDGEGHPTLVQRQTDLDPLLPPQTTQYIYDHRGRPSSEIHDPGGLNLTTQYSYDGNNNRIQLTDPRNKPTKYTYDGQNRLVKVEDALHHFTQTQYDPVGNRVCAIDANQHYVTFHPDALNRTDLEIRKMGSENQNCDNLVYDSNDLVTQTAYDSGNTIPAADCKNSECAGPVPGSSNPVRVIDPEGKYSYFKYDHLNRRVLMLRKAGDNVDAKDGNDWAEADQYDGASNVVARTDANGNFRVYDFYKDNLLKAETLDPGTKPQHLNDITAHTYDGAHNLVTTTTPRGNTITNAYSDRNELIQADDLVGRGGSYAYDGVGNRVQDCDGNNNCTRYIYDAVNRLVNIIDPMNNASVNAYDPDGNLVKLTDRENHVTCHYYDDINRRTRTAQLMGGSNCAVLPATALWTDTEYDGVGNVTRLITAKQSSTPPACAGASPPADCEITRYQYDAANRLLLETYADATTRAFQYDKAGNLSQRTDQLGQVTQYGYNDLYYLLLRDYQDPAEPDDSFQYDIGGRMTRAERAAWVVTYDGYDAANRLLQTTQDASGLPMVVRYAYDTAAGTRAVTYPGGRSCNEQKDLRERLGQNACDSFEATYAYDLGNRVQTRAYNNGVTANYSYDADNRITSLTHSGGVADFGYAYDKEGNKQYEQKNHDPSKSEAYAYDEVYRLIDYKVGNLVGSTVPVPSTQTQYNLDKVGNWDQFAKDDDGAGPGVPIVYQNTPNQMNEYDDLSTNGPGEIPDDLGIANNFKDNAATPAPDGENWAHDKNGNRREDGKRLYVYDDENRLVRVTRKDSGLVSEYRYDALSRRVSKIVGVGMSPVTTRYAYDDARIIEEQDGAAATLATYIYGNYIDEVLNMQRTGVDYYYHQNALWSVIAVTNASAAVMERYAYSDYGCPSVIHSAIGNPWMFTGRQWDEESGLYFYRARYYDCEVGRFLQRDPLGYSDGMNSYQYAASSSTKNVDPLGKFGIYGMCAQSEAGHCKDGGQYEYEESREYYCICCSCYCLEYRNCIQKVTLCCEELFIFSDMQKEWISIGYYWAIRPEGKPKCTRWRTRERGIPA